MLASSSTDDIAGWLVDTNYDGNVTGASRTGSTDSADCRTSTNHPHPALRYGRMLSREIGALRYRFVTV